MCRGLYQVRPPLPYTPGIELCGEVLAAGPDVTGIAPGDRLVGGPVGGAFAELALMNAASALPAPDGLDDAEAAAFFVTYQTGWFGLYRRAGSAKCIAFEGRILIIGFAGGQIQSAALNHALIKQSKNPQLIRDCHAQLTKLVADGAIRPLVSERLGLDEVPAGLQRLADGGTVGRIVFVP
jgi:NADPH:quinone reductase-like Zn-dependent oxidoreductase